MAQPNVILELREDNGDLTEPIGLSQVNASDLIDAGKIVMAQVVVQYDLAPGVELNDVLEEL